MRTLLFISVYLLAAFTTVAQSFFPLWPEGKKPNFNGKTVSDSLYNERIWRVGTPGVFAFIVPKSENKGSAVLICPGGGYERVSHIYNGFNLAKWYNAIGVNVFVLLYRLPHQTDLKQRELAPLQDAQRAMRLIRSNAAAWNLRPDKIGVMGVSAGGHVASTLGTYTGDESAIGDSLDSFSYLPDFMVLLSPVITMGKFAHPGSRKNFLGPDSTDAMIRRFSGELRVNTRTPPCFIVHAQNDSTVNVQNSIQFYSALQEKKISSSLHIFPQGGHGIRLDDNPGSTELWTSLLELWLKEMNFVTPLPFR